MKHLNRDREPNEIFADISSDRPENLIFYKAARKVDAFCFGMGTSNGIGFYLYIKESVDQQIDFDFRK